MANIVNTEETYLKEQSDQCLYSLPPQGKPFTPYLAHITLPKKNSVKQIRLCLQEWSDLCYSISSDRISCFQR